jgi:hypothetical protein
MRKRRKQKEPTPRQKQFCFLLCTMAIGSALLLIWGIAVAGLLQIADMVSAEMVTFLAALGLALAGGAVGYFAGFWRRRHGLFLGIACGLSLYLLRTGIGFLWLGEPGSWLGAVLLVASSGIGGICGVNGERKHRKR